MSAGGFSSPRRQNSMKKQLSQTLSVLTNKIFISQPPDRKGDGDRPSPRWKYELTLLFRFNESIKSSAPTPVRSSTPGREVSSKPRPKLSAAVQVTVRPSTVAAPKEKSISSFSQSSTYISSTDDSISPGQILNSFGEFKISQRIKDKIANGRDSLSEGRNQNFCQKFQPHNFR